jgi:hypothetical protein
MEKFEMAAARALVICVSCALGFVIVGCGDDSSDPPVGDAGSGGGMTGGIGGASGAMSGGTGGMTGGTGGASGAMSGGTGGMTGGTGGASGMTGGGGGMTGGSGGASGMTGGGMGGGGAGGNSLPAPAVDCSTRTDTDHCFSARGEIDGMPFDMSCTMDPGGLRAQVPVNGTWVISCDELATERRIDLTLPYQDPGMISFDTADGMMMGLEIRVSTPSRNASSARDNLERMIIGGEMSMQAGTDAIILAGSFEAEFTETGDLCDPPTCPPASISASFRSVLDF